MLQGYKSKIAAVLLAIGGVGQIINGDTLAGITVIANALAVFGIADKIDRAS